MADFLDFINKANLLDPPLSGAKYTWHREGSRPIQTRIDRFLISLDWYLHHLSFTQTTKPRPFSDHSLLSLGPAFSNPAPPTQNGGAFPKHEKKAASAAPVEKPPKFYPADDVKKPLVNKRKARPTKLRAIITPGTVLIILAGRFKGKRVVFLKQLTSGLLLVTGPFKINGVPLRRVNQSYVIATSTKVDISGVTLDKFDDKYFGKQAEKKKKKAEGEFFEAEKEEKSTLPQEKKDDQKSVDAALIKSIEAVQDLKSYLGARFSLRAGMKPHELVF